ncbi:SDR family oxidoreductase [Prevotella sp. RM4]|uniref:SDR family oxidoreductase n=1 Tax=Prevotella sp. RM4 TaxID=1200547 RepID=UPI00051B577B|nr:SDR family oxidoreductase [Prevotella sp. RM4]
MSKILVTGGAGFIGSNLCEYLVNKGHCVICLDNFSTGHMENIAALMENHPCSFQLIEGDIRSFETCIKAASGVDYILHEAALGSIPRSINDPITTNDVNIGGFLNMLVAARDLKIKRFIFAASSSTYGDNKDLPKVENNIGKPMSPYALTKLVDELYADVFAKTYDMEFIGLRYFNVFGRRQDPNSMYAAVIPLFIKQYMSLKQPRINGDGSNSRDFTYIDNVIQMNELALITSNPHAINQIYNTACGERTTINQLASFIKGILIRYNPEISNINPIYGPNRTGDIPHSLASIEKAKKYLDYMPSYTFYKGLEETIKWYWNEYAKKKASIRYDNI